MRFRCFRRSIQFMLLAGFLFGLSSCSVVRKFYPPIRTKHLATDESYKKEVREKFDEGTYRFQQKQYLKAVDAFDRLNKEYPSSKFAQEADFLSGRSYEHLNGFDRAVEKYRSVVAHKSAGDSLRTASLYRLSFAYEKLGQEVNALAALKDAMARKEHLEKEVALAEGPARLAALYARAGNEKQADVYFQVAEKGIYQLRKGQPATETPPWLPKTLYYMGNINLDASMTRQFDGAVRPLKKTQSFLLRAAELEDGKWSDQAADSLMDIYNNLWQMVQNTSATAGKDRVLSERARQRRQWDMTLVLIESLEELQRQAGPASADQKATVKILNFARLQKDKFQEFLRRPEVGRGLTPEARERFGVPARYEEPKSKKNSEEAPVKIKDLNL